MANTPAPSRAARFGGRANCKGNGLLGRQQSSCPKPKETRGYRGENEKGQYRMERSYGSFERSIPLPVEVDESKAKAEFKKGVLRLTLPKRPGAQSRRKKI